MPTTLIAEAVFFDAFPRSRTIALRRPPSCEAPSPPSLATGRSLSRTSAALCTPPRSSATLKASCSCAQPPEYDWKLNYGNIALMWRGGCIIRSAFLGKIKDAYDKHPRLQNLLLDTFFKRAIRHSQKGWRNVVAVAAKRGIPVPAFSTALAFLTATAPSSYPPICSKRRGIISARTPTNALTNRVANSSTNWTGRGGDVSSTTYNA